MEGVLPVLGLGPEAVVLRCGGGAAVGVGADDDAAGALLGGALHLEEEVFDAGHGREGEPDEAVGGDGAEVVEEPVVIGLDAGELEVGVVAIGVGAGEGHAGIKDLGLEHVDLHLFQAGVGIVAGGADAVVGVAALVVVGDFEAGGGGELDLLDAFAAVERPGLHAVLEVDHLGGAVFECGGDAFLPDVGLVEVAVGVDYAVVHGSPLAGWPGGHNRLGRSLKGGIRECQRRWRGQGRGGAAPCGRSRA